EIRRSHTWQGYAATGTMLSAGLLGLFYSWLEEPGFMLPIAVSAGLAMVGRRAVRTTPVSIVSAYSPLRTPSAERPAFAPAISVHPAGLDDR
ncbi:MAG TPA: hypothetical protein VHB50_23105, partial [Bryobacteraceae bacterium]|nr:hypothetical protein [Bryobacteraceae bacterium]